MNKNKIFNLRILRPTVRETKVIVGGHLLRGRLRNARKDPFKRTRGGGCLTTAGHHPATEILGCA